jgi:hypothetical protein
MRAGQPLGHEVLLEVTSTKDLTELINLLTIEESKNGWHCMCYGEQALEFRDGEGAVFAVLGFHHGSTIRWDEWSSDGQLQNGQAAVEWFGAHGVDVTEQTL